MTPSFQLMADVSSNNGEVNLTNYRLAGHTAIAIKATEGMNYVNPYHLSQCHEAHRNGLTVIHYHYCHPNPNIEGEISHFRNQYLKGWQNGDQIAFDLEVTGSVDLVKYANSLLSDFFTKTGHPPILYTYQSFASEKLKGVKVPGNRWWIAKYSPGSPNFPGITLWGWQYTDGESGNPPHYYTGIGKCDGTILNKGEAIKYLINKKRKRFR